LGTKTIFIVSLPRSGSTLLRSLIITDESIKGLSEAWLLLPLLTFDQPEKYISTYGSAAVNKAMSEYEDLGGSVKDLKREIAKTAVTQIAKGLKTNIIVDKTPRYYQALSELKSLEDEFNTLIILRRPILEVIASYEKTFSNIFFKVPLFKNEFIDGPIAMSKEFSSSTIIVDYEELITDTKAVVNRINKKLNINCDIDKASIGKNTGVFGDPKFGEKSSIEAIKLRYIDWTSYYYYRFRIKPKLSGEVDKEFLSERNIQIKFSFKSLLNLLFLPIASFIRIINLKASLSIFNKKYFG
tara:strand:+ start:121 stop:1014 length:894 start_codon:yes stop_codon:yes gene_type:complete